MLYERKSTVCSMKQKALGAHAWKKNKGCNTPIWSTYWKASKQVSFSTHRLWKHLKALVATWFLKALLATWHSAWWLSWPWSNGKNKKKHLIGGHWFDFFATQTLAKILFEGIYQVRPGSLAGRCRWSGMRLPMGDHTWCIWHTTGSSARRSSSHNGSWSRRSSHSMGYSLVGHPGPWDSSWSFWGPSWAWSSCFSWSSGPSWAWSSWAWSS